MDLLYGSGGDVRFGETARSCARVVQLPLAVICFRDVVFACLNTYVPTHLRFQLWPLGMDAPDSTLSRLQEEITVLSFPPRGTPPLKKFALLFSLLQCWRRPCDSMRNCLHCFHCLHIRHKLARIRGSSGGNQWKQGPPGWRQRDLGKQSRVW